MILDTQHYPIVDSTPANSFETLVAVYYQLKGYITSSNKWFWTWEEGKRQRAYQDIDVLAVNGTETIIVSVTGSLDDKISSPGDHHLSADRLGRLQFFFDKAVSYLESVPQYSWMVGNERQIRKVLVFGGSDQSAAKFLDPLSEHGIELLSGEQTVRCFKEELSKLSKLGYRASNEFVKIAHMMNAYG